MGVRNAETLLRGEKENSKEENERKQEDWMEEKQAKEEAGGRGRGGSGESLQMRKKIIKGHDGTC